jgi:type II secretion system protein H
LRDSRSKSREAGVTLIEMMVVMVIIALIAAIAVPSLTAGLDSVRLKTAADSIASFLNVAVNRAERLGEPVEVDIAPKENRIGMTSSRYSQELDMPSGVIIEGVLPKKSDGWGDDVRHVILQPGATIPGIGVQIMNKRGVRRLIRIDPMTGFPRIEAVEQ